LLTCARVQSQRIESALFRHARQRNSNNVFVIPAQAYLHGEWNLHRGTYRLKNFPDCRQILEQARTSIALDHPLGGTTQVQINQVKACILYNFRRLSESVGIAAKKLSCNRMLVFIEMEIAFALLLPRAEQAVSRGELSHDQTASRDFIAAQTFRSRIILLRYGHYILDAADKTCVADKAAENRIGDSGHGSKDCCRCNAHRADLQRLRYPRALRSGACGDRIFPEFMHFGS